LASLARGIAALHRRSEVAEEDLQDAFRVGFDCLPQDRRRLLLASMRGENAQVLRMPPTVKMRVRQELEALEVCDSTGRLTEEAARLLEKADVIIDGLVPY
jgi:hypothetical protein